MKLFNACIILGTRPEAIKLAPVILKFKDSPEFKTTVISTGQHTDIVDSVMQIFDLKSDFDLRIMNKNQSLNYITSTLVEKLGVCLREVKPDIVFVQGDTTSAFAASLASFYEKIPVAHIEAGLRTNDKYSPFPEEINRRLISQIATLHFAPTKESLNNLNEANIHKNIFNVGNTVIDSMKIVLKNVKRPNFQNIDWGKDKVILATAHRRENLGRNLENFAKGIKRVLDQSKNISLILPMHPNPKVRETLKKHLSNQPKICLTEPLNYKEFLAVLKNCFMVITDSGGLQEEAPFLKKPLLIFRDTTERMEAVVAGSSKLIGTSADSIEAEVLNLINNNDDYKKMTKFSNLFGNGTASKKILKETFSFLNQ